MVDGRVLSVLVIGEVGSGKSSVVNLLVGDKVAEVSPDAEPCTTETVKHETTIQVQKTRTTVHIWEVVGFNQPEEINGKESVPALDKYLGPILQAKASVDVILFCMRGTRVKSAPTRVAKYIKNVSNGRISIVPVITYLESEENMEGWWERNGQGVQKIMGLGEIEHACVTGLQEEKLKDKSTQSRTSLVEILERRYSSSEGSVPLESILGEQRKDSSWWKSIWPF